MFEYSNFISYDQEDRVNSTNAEYANMREQWDIVSSLLGGTKRMRGLGQKYLPKYATEQENDYKRRLNVSVLAPIYKEIIQNISNKPFNKNISMNNFDERLVEWSDNIDLQGHDLTSFLEKVFYDAWAYGLSHILSTYAMVNDGFTPSRQEERRNNLRPYFIHIKAEQLFGWTYENRSGNRYLTSIRWIDSYSDVEGFKQIIKPIIYYLYIEDSKLYFSSYILEENQWVVKDTPVLIKKGDGSSFDYIPLRTFYTSQEGFLYVQPPLIDVAYLNVLHWQALSDQNNILTWARVPILEGRGYKTPSNEYVDEVEENPIKVGVGTVIMSPENASLNYVEHSGTSINSGFEYLENIEKSARNAGNDIIRTSTAKGGISATQMAVTAAQETTTIKKAVKVFQDMVEQAFIDLTMFDKNLSQEDVGSLVFDTNLMNIDSDNKASDVLLKLNQLGKISDETLLNEIKRRGILHEDIDVVAEIERSTQSNLNNLNNIDDIDNVIELP